MKTMNLKFSAYLAIALLASIVIAHVSGFASADPRVAGMNAVAGYGTTLTVDGMDAYHPLLYTLTDPRGQQFSFRGYTDGNGSTSYHLDETYTRVAGVYRVQVQDTKSTVQTKVSMFTIYPDQASPSVSQFLLSKSSVKVGAYDFALATVRVVDAYGNPLPHHFVQIVSTRAHDLIRPYVTGQNSTNEQGEVTFALTSQQAGTSVYTAFDLTSQVSIGTPTQVEYGSISQATSPHSSHLQANILGIGGDVNSLIAQAIQEAGPAYRFIFEQMPLSVKVNQPLDFTITAYDIANAIATGYTGTVRFSAIGDNSAFVSFPQDYTFLPSDLGRHVFPLSLQFQQEGTYQLRVQDTVNQSLLGTVTVVVKGGGSGLDSGNATVMIASPSPGSYSSNIQTISGSAPAGKDVKIYDSNEEIGTVVANLKGQFEYTTQPLVDGPHEFVALAVDQKGLVLGTSQKVSLTINTQPPTLQSVELIPGFTVTPNISVQIRVTSAPHLRSLILDMNGTQSELVEDIMQPGLYTGTFAPPAQAGQYDLHFVLKDALNNQTTATYDQKLIVTAGSAQPLKPVKNIRTAPDTYKVTLSWDDLDNPPQIVKNYRIFYGVAPTQLNSFVDTSGSVRTWYVPNLENGVTYYFGVVAMDMSGNFGEGGTLAIATPGDPASLKANLPAADTLIDSASVYGETGPAVLWLFPVSFAAYRAARRIRRGSRQ